MNGILQFDFLVDREKNTISVKKEFAAGRQLVWDCFTKKELLEQWFAPRPFTIKTGTMDFNVGGYWLYAMVDPTGPEYWGRADYLEITPIAYYSARDSFCDKNGVQNADLPTAIWKVTFHDKNDNSLVDIEITYDSLQSLDQILKMGMQEGFTMTLQQLDELVAKERV